MNDKFDELAKNLAQSVTRRQALRRFGACLAGALLACLGLNNSAKADALCQGAADYTSCGAGFYCCNGKCVDLITDKNNCGSCGNNCTGNHLRCNSGHCEYYNPHSHCC